MKVNSKGQISCFKVTDPAKPSRHDFCSNLRVENVSGCLDEEGKFHGSLLAMPGLRYLEVYGDLALAPIAHLRRLEHLSLSLDDNGGLPAPLRVNPATLSSLVLSGGHRASVRQCLVFGKSNIRHVWMCAIPHTHDSLVGSHAAVYKSRTIHGHLEITMLAWNITIISSMHGSGVDLLSPKWLTMFLSIVLLNSKNLGSKSRIMTVSHKSSEG